MSSALLVPAPDVTYWELEEAPDDEDVRPAFAIGSRSVVQDDSDAEARRKAADTKAQFDILADELEDASAGMSSTRRAVQHPAYIGILALGEEAIPLLLGRLDTSRNRPILLRLLSSLTAFQPGAGRETISEAAAQWVRWGKREGRVV